MMAAAMPWAPSLLTSYRHYKGGSYTLLHIAENSEDRSELMAVYVSHLKGKVLVRPLAMFNEIVPWPDGQMRPRFAPLVGAPDQQPDSAEKATQRNETPANTGVPISKLSELVSRWVGWVRVHASMKGGDGERLPFHDGLALALEISATELAVSAGLPLPPRIAR
jgi:hypothetical protein